MRKVYGCAIHHRAASDYAVYPAQLALPNSLLGNAPLTEGAVKPDLVNSKLYAIAHDLGRDIRMGGDHDGLDRLRH
jgi:hypothetical protein